MPRVVSLLALLAFATIAAGPGPAAAQPACDFVLGFKTLHDLIPDLVGTCLEDQRTNPVNGDALQRTGGGLLVWRKADNWTAFTDGATTWVNGRFGLQARPNAERFPWESAQPVGEGGIEGRVTLGPTCPGPQRLGQVCERPYQATVVVLDAQGREVTRFQSAIDGTFRVPLPPGGYTLRPESPGMLPRAAEQLVRVDSGRFTPVEIRYDTGIR